MPKWLPPKSTATHPRECLGLVPNYEGPRAPPCSHKSPDCSWPYCIHFLVSASKFVEGSQQWLEIPEIQELHLQSTDIYCKAWPFSLELLRKRCICHDDLLYLHQPSQTPCHQTNLESFMLSIPGFRASPLPSPHNSGFFVYAIPSNHSHPTSTSECFFRIHLEAECMAPTCPKSK